MLEWLTTMIGQNDQENPDHETPEDDTDSIDNPLDREEEISDIETLNEVYT
jgi:hypothetical protein